MPPIDACNAVAVRTVFLLSLITPVCSMAQTPVSEPPPVEKSSDWHLSAYADLAYLLDFNFPENHLWRSRSTSQRVNELAPNMGFLNLTKEMTTDSRWGMEVGIQGGYDAKTFGFLQDEPRVGGSDTLRHIQRANVSYLAPVGNGLSIQAGLFNSLIGYESFYAKDNANYTRSWIADNTPYMMFGVNARYPVNDRLTIAGFIINGYYHLSRPNDQPSYGTQIVYRPAADVTVTETLYAGPDQSKTAFEFWRFYLNSIVERKTDDFILAFSYDIGTESIANQPGTPRTFVTGGNVVARWRIDGHWAVALRPEFYWDRNGRWTGHEQFLKAVTTTLEYAVPFGWTRTRARLEYRWDESVGAGGGFYKGGDVAPGTPGLTASQHLLIMALLWSFYSP
ncbi:MAG TPA: outer membrane beta-barrel protein [Nitrospira sp.]|nr:outer membrane beta-barrel protein [Nitrospira sp.]